jgi:NADH-quinone oxidoreductase subunit N
MNLGAFGVVLAVGRKGEPNEEFSDYAGLGFRYPALGMAMTIFMLSLTGVPPLVGFTGKFYIFSAAVKAGYVWLAVIGVLNSAISAYYYIRVVVNMYMREGEKQVDLLSARPALAAAILVAAIGTVVMGVFPAASISLAKISFLSLG